MKKYNNFCITWTEDGADHEKVMFSKMDAIREYINLLFAHVDSGRDISDLKILGARARGGYALEDITGTVNRFLNR